MSDTLTEAMAKVVAILSPLEADQRRRVIQAAFALLGEPAPVAAKPGGTPQQASGEQEGDLPTAAAAASWLAKAKVPRDKLEHCLHFEDGKVKVIALPGSATKRIDQVITAYLMQGFAAFLQTGDASFTDQDARDLCEHFGCYDHTNHAKYLKEFGNRITGSKSTGWKLTAPGLTAIAELVKA